MQHELDPVPGLDRPRVWTVPSPSGPDGAIRSAPTPDPGGTPRVWGLSAAERIRRGLHRAPGVDVDADLVVAADLIVDEKVLAALARRPGTLLLDEDDQPAAVCVAPDQRGAAIAVLRGGVEARDIPGLWVVSAPDLVDTYDPLLRKAEPPVVARVTEANAAQLEERLFRASYKGVTDFVTKWVWPRPARAVTRALSRTGITPNAVTLLSWLLVIATTLFFAAGEYGWGLVSAWWMTFLDTVDGKLARVTLRSSRLGHVLDHGLDLAHPPFWYAAWVIGMNPAPSWWTQAAWCVIGGYIAGRLLEGAFMLIFRFETHSWRPIDSWFRTITARRNPNLVLLTLGTVVGQPALGFGAVALWTAFSLGFHGVRLLQAAASRLRGRPVRPWYVARGAPAATLAALALDPRARG